MASGISTPIAVNRHFAACPNLFNRFPRLGCHRRLLHPGQSSSTEPPLMNRYVGDFQPSTLSYFLPLSGRLQYLNGGSHPLVTSSLLYVYLAFVLTPLTRSEGAVYQDQSGAGRTFRSYVWETTDAKISAAASSCVNTSEAGGKTNWAKHIG
jgi:hypothetical protein